MKCLLDTHVLVWWLYGTARLTARAHEAIAAPENTIAVSAVSAFEIANKHRVGKWHDIASLALAFEEIVTSQGFVVIPITAHHASRAGLLPDDHRDPFDRLLAAQAEIEELRLLTSDPMFKAFGTQTIW